jgi:hypothetical protein
VPTPVEGECEDCDCGEACCTILGCLGCGPGCSVCVTVADATGSWAPLIGLSATVPYAGQDDGVADPAVKSCLWQDFGNEFVHLSPGSVEGFYAIVKATCDTANPANNGYQVLGPFSSQAHPAGVPLGGLNSTFGYSAGVGEPDCDDGFLATVVNGVSWVYDAPGPPTPDYSESGTVTYSITAGPCGGGEMMMMSAAAGRSAKNPAGGPGTELKALAAAEGVALGCAGRRVAGQMDRWGVAGCDRQFDAIAGRLQEMAVAKKWPRPDQVPVMVAEAIRRARAKAGKK